MRFDKIRRSIAGWLSTVQASWKNISRQAAKRCTGDERTGGEPSVIDHDPRTGRLTFCDCLSGELAGRRSLCDR